MRSTVSLSVTHQLLFAATLFIHHHHLAAATAAASVVNDTIRIGYFMTSDRYRAAAMNLAIEQARDEGIMSQYNFR